MKKTVSMLFVISLVLLSVPTPAIAQEIKNNEIPTAADAIVLYESAVNSPEWQSSVNRQERGEMVQLSEEMLTMPTAELVEAVLAYPFFSDVFFFDNTQLGMNVLYDTFNGVRELSERDDAAQILLEVYENEPVLTAEAYSTEMDSFRLPGIELLLTQDYIVEKMTAEEIAALSTLSVEKYEAKTESSVYGTLSENLFFTALGVSTESVDLESDVAALLSDISTQNADN